MRKFFLILAVVIILLAGAGVYLTRGGKISRIILEQAVKRYAPAGEAELAGQLLGLDSPRTYLVLFLNNTELRPGGGFIGAYALMRVENGWPRILKVEGTELLDNRAPKNILPPPPPPLAKYLKVNQWAFRDSNWSPDFAVSASTSLALFKLEGGLDAEKVDFVLGITPTVAEELLKLIGPITIGGQTFNHRNVVEQVEYQVEYGYAQKGQSFADRKKLLSELAPAVLKKVAFDALTKRALYTTLAERLLAQKQIIIYARSAALQATLVDRGWAGRSAVAPADYLLWVDANLGALKTDWAIERELTYRLATSSARTTAAAAIMRYRHLAPRDWRTSRYQTYTRIFVPAGSRLIKVSGGYLGAIETMAPVDQGEELGKQWFGVYFTVRPESEAWLQFDYEIAPPVAAAINSGVYRAVIQKQIGTAAHPLTLDLKFDTKVLSARPGEISQQHGDNNYRLTTDLSVDREFMVSFR